MVKKDNNYCIYAGYEKTSHFRPCVFEQLRGLSLRYNIVYVTILNNPNIKNDLLFKSIREITNHIIIRDNIGYDFGSWKEGISFLKPKINSINSLLLMNDSLYGPLFSMEEILNRTLNSSCDITSMTSNVQEGYHAQSYYISYKNNVINSDLFKNFWESLELKKILTIKDKYDLVLKNEVGFYQTLKSSGFSHETLFDTGNGYNQTIFDWEKLVYMGMPFIKNTLLFKKTLPKTTRKINIDNLARVIFKNKILAKKMLEYWKKCEI